MVFAAQCWNFISIKQCVTAVIRDTSGNKWMTMTWRWVIGCGCVAPPARQPMVKSPSAWHSTKPQPPSAPFPCRSHNSLASLCLSWLPLVSHTVFRLSPCPRPSLWPLFFPFTPALPSVITHPSLPVSLGLSFSFPIILCHVGSPYIAILIPILPPPLLVPRLSSSSSYCDLHPHNTVLPSILLPLLVPLIPTISCSSPSFLPLLFLFFFILLILFRPLVILPVICNPHTYTFTLIHSYCSLFLFPPLILIILLLFLLFPLFLLLILIIIMFLHSNLAPTVIPLPF